MIALVIIYGLLIGSFLNVLIYRIPREESITFPGSHCPECNHKLKWYDNIPLISYIMLQGKCRYCGAKISIQYPLIETLNAIVYVFLYISFGWSIDFVFYALIASVLIAIAGIDLKEQIIPDSLVVSILVFEVLHKAANYFVIGHSPRLVDSLLGLAVGGGIFLIIVLVSRGGMGGGDVTLIGALGFVLGFKYILLTIFFSFILGAIISVFLLATKLKTRKDPIPFGPFIIVGFFIVLMYGEQILDWYFNILI
jgi:leader peptidase (prepilin peptidase)/N-methyltransferase